MWRWVKLGGLALPVLIWGGVRGGIALALSLHEGPARFAALVTTYVVVLFAVIVQGGTISWVLRRFAREPAPSDARG